MMVEDPLISWPKAGVLLVYDRYIRESFAGREDNNIFPIPALSKPNSKISPIENLPQLQMNPLYLTCPKDVS